MKYFHWLTRTSFSLLVVTILASCNNNGAEKNAQTDTSANASTNLVPGSSVKLDPTKRYIYLTWDDSPQPPGTVNCKEVFKAEGVKATFFAVGFNLLGPAKRRLIDSIRASYPQFLLANHSFSHGFRDQYSKFYSPAMTDSALNDFLKNEAELKIPVKIIRLPGNNGWAANGVIEGQKSNSTLVKKLDSMGYKIVGWDLEWNQNGKKKEPKESADEMVKRINQKFDDETTNQPNAIVILSHDRLFEKKQFADTLSRFLSIMKADKRYVFETIDHYPSIQK